MSAARKCKFLLNVSVKIPHNVNVTVETGLG